MKKTRKIRLLAFILTLCLILGALPIYVFADEVEEIPEELQDRIVEEVPFEPEYLPGDLTFAECRTATLNMAEVPAVISQAQIEQYQHVNRLYEQEPDLYTVIFQNRDGSKTVYVFAQPVKSVSGNGAVTDMSAAAIVSAHQPALPSQNAMMQSSLSQNVAPILAMQERLDSYKAANDLKDYQMLDDVLEATTVSASSALVLNNSVSVASVSTTYSSLAGEYAIRNIGASKYLTYYYDLLMTSYITIPQSKWLLEYYGNSFYSLRPLYSQADLLTTDFNTEELFLSVEDDPIPSNQGEYQIWSIVAEEHGYRFIQQMYLLSASDNNVSIVYDIYSEYELWEFTNYSTFVPLTNVTIDGNVITGNVDEYVYVPSIETNAGASYADPSDDFVWYTTNDSMLTPDMDSFFVLETGIAQIYCKHLYTGIESNRVTVIVSETPPAGEAITSGAVYLIRPYAETIDASTKLLTMNVASTGNTLSLSSWGTQYGSEETVHYKWNSLSQAFTLTQNADGSYKISAIMSTNQYYVPFSPTGEFSYNGTYTLTNKDIVANTLTRTSSNSVSLKAAVDSNGVNQLTDSDKWFVYIEDGKHYIINISGATVYYLTYNITPNTATGTVSVSTEKSSCDWLITFFGVDAPLIKQTTHYYCGVASTLQVLMTANASGFTGNIDLGERMRYLNSIYTMTSSSAGILNKNKITDALNGVLGADTYDLMLAANCNKNTVEPKIISSLKKGRSLIASIYDRLNYYPASYSGHTHYVCVIGYDEATDLVLIADCIYESNFGLHVVKIEDLVGAFNNGLYYYNK